MTKTPEASALPWEVESDDETHIVTIHAADGSSVFFSDDNGYVSDVDAALIVRAVNCYQEFIQIARGVLDYFLEKRECPICRRFPHEPACAVLAVLAKAEGR